LIINAKNLGLDASLFEAIIDTNKNCRYHELLGIMITALIPGEATLEATIDERHINPHQTAHGGLAFSLADTAMVMTIRTYNQNVVTIDININYLDSAKPGDILTATGTVVALGKKIIVAEAKVINQDRQLIAVARGTFYNCGHLILSE
jgi:acyl-CoA thioesterase